MSIFELFLLALALSMDAFAVSICIGLAGEKTNAANAAAAGIYFGGFQSLMPLIGYLLGIKFAGLITAYDHWIAFILLSFIGGRMVIGSFEKQTGDQYSSLNFKRMLVLALATSIDALAVGVSFAFLTVKIAPAVAFIGLITFTLSFTGVKLGAVLGERFKSRSELSGGVILILIGLKILLEHLNIINF